MAEGDDIAFAGDHSLWNVGGSPDPTCSFSAAALNPQLMSNLLEWPLSEMSWHSSQQTPGAPALKLACIGCRTSKAGCDSHRPCSRCVRLGRPCEDRSAEDVATALARRRHQLPPDPAAPASTARTARTNRPSKAAGVKRARGQQIPDEGAGSSQSAQHQRTPSQQLLSVPAHGLAVAPTGSCDVQPAAGAASRLLLAALETAQLRDRFLAMEAAASCDASRGTDGASCARGLGSVAVGRVGASLARDIPAGVRRSLHLCLLQLSSSLQCDDFTRFIVDGLDDHQRYSLEFLSSTLAAWAVPTTRPLRFDFTHSPDSNVLIFEAATTAAAAHSEYGNRCSHARPADQPAYSSHLPSSGDTSVFSRSDATAVPALHVEFTSDAYKTFLQWDDSMALRRANLVSPSPPDFSALVDTPLMPVQVGINCLSLSEDASVGDSLIGTLNSNDAASVRKPASEEDDSYSPSRRHSLSQTGSSHEQHASWCSSRGGGGAIAATVSASSTLCSKWRSHFCSCALSMPLPAVVQVNHAFEELFGVTAAQVKKGFEELGMGFLSTLYPASEWASLQRAQLEDLLGAPFSKATWTAPIASADGAWSSGGLTQPPLPPAVSSHAHLMASDGLLLSEHPTRVLCHGTQSSSLGAKLTPVRLIKRITHRNGFIAHTLLWQRTSEKHDSR